MNIAILDDYQNVILKLPCFSRLAEHEVVVFNDTPAEDVLVERLKDIDALVLIRERTRITATLLSQLPQLKLISQTGKISNHLDLAACTAHGVAVAEGVGSPVAPAELCWSLIMAASRHIVPYAEHLKQDQWQQSGPLGLGRTLNGLTLGIWGYGKIGKRIARFGAAFDMKVLIWGREPSREQALKDGYQCATSKDEFFAIADVLSLHLRLNDATRGCVTATDLRRMKTDALLVNTSRSGLIEEGALVRALQAGRPGFAALDVYNQEPVRVSNEPLLSLPNVLCSPHLGYVESNSYQLYFDAAFNNLVKFASGFPQNIANPEVLTCQRQL